MSVTVPRKNKTKAKMLAGEVPIGVFLFDPSPRVVELCGALGFDFVTYDAEGGPVNYVLAEELARAADAVGITPIIRPLSHDPKGIGQYLDSGFQGILVPAIDTAAQARSVAAAARYHPQGTRGLGPARAALYGHVTPFSEFVKAANEEVLIMGMIEHIDAMKELGDILDTPGIDSFDIGTWDLAASMGHAGNAGHPDVQAVVETILAEARKRNRVMGYTLSSFEQAQDRLASGYRRLSLSFNGVTAAALRTLGDQIRGAVAELKA